MATAKKPAHKKPAPKKAPPKNLPPWLQKPAKKGY